MSKSHDRFIADTNTEYLMSRIAELEAKLATVADEKLVESLDRWWHMENEELPALRADLAQLVEAVEQIRDKHLIPLANQEGQDLLRMDLNDLDDALERKEPQQ